MHLEIDLTIYLIPSSDLEQMCKARILRCSHLANSSPIYYKCSFPILFYLSNINISHCYYHLINAILHYIKI